MLTGDSAAASAPIADQAGIDEVEAGLDPAGKLARIRALQQEGLRVAMVGDGINDAARTGPGRRRHRHGSGADLAQEAGDVLLLRAQPTSIPAAIDLARATVGIMQAKPDVGRLLQRRRHPARRGAVVSRFPHSAQSMGGCRGHGAQFGQRAGEQPAPAPLATHSLSLAPAR